MKKELDERGVSYRGLLEKAEFVDLLVDARVRGITAPTGGGEGGADGGDSTDAGPKKGEYDPSYKDVKVRERSTKHWQCALTLTVLRSIVLSAQVSFWTEPAMTVIFPARRGIGTTGDVARGFHVLSSPDKSRRRQR